MKRRSLLRTVAALLLVAPRLAFAELGADASTISVDRVRMQGALLRITTTDSYTVHELQSSTGTSVRQYVSPAGTVFAVAWTGPWMPDLRQLLGTYFDRYQRAADAARRSHRGHGPLTITDGDLVVQVAGHPRAFTGVATVMRLAPAGIRADAIR